MKRTHNNFLRAILLLGLCLSLTLGFTKPVQAAVVCIWEGDTSADWFTIANWSCGHVPNEGDNVEISSGTTNQPTIGAMNSVTVNSITINSGAVLTILSGSIVNAGTWTIDGDVTANTGDSLIYINYFAGTGSGVVNVSSTGTFTTLGTGDLFLMSTFNNAGTVDIQVAGFILNRGGTHTGLFQGGKLFIGFDATGQTYNFNTGADIRVTQLSARGGTVNITGTYSPPVTGSYLIVQPNSGTSLVHIKTGASILRMAETTDINYGGKLILESQAYDYAMFKLNLDYNGELQNFDNLTIATQFLWMAGKITGDGTTTVENPAVFRMGTSVYTQNDFTLDTQTLVNNSTANWNKRNLTVSNAAEFVNNGTFNANATTTMSGGETECFTNNGSFIKNTAGTTTTMDIPFTNNGTVTVVAGELVFKMSGGTFDPGDTLTLGNGESLVGSGTLAANLVNGGTVSPGVSPGRITVDGDYTQLESGLLIIELGGTTADTEYDQLVVTGTATMHGTLTVTILPGFTPQAGDTFFIIDHVTGTGTFDTVSLPTLAGGLKMGIDFSDDYVTLTVVEDNTFYIYLPLIVK